VADLPLAAWCGLAASLCAFDPSWRNEGFRGFADYMVRRILARVPQTAQCFGMHIFEMMRFEALGQRNLVKLRIMTRARDCAALVGPPGRRVRKSRAHRTDVNEALDVIGLQHRHKRRDRQCGVPESEDGAVRPTRFLRWRMFAHEGGVALARAPSCVSIPNAKRGASSGTPVRAGQTALPLERLRPGPVAHRRGRGTLDGSHGGAGWPRPPSAPSSRTGRNNLADRVTMAEGPLRRPFWRLVDPIGYLLTLTTLRILDRLTGPEPESARCCRPRSRARTAARYG
jgi:hypothetical protein